MATLTIHQFSCIESAQLEIGQMTLLIGPQASGKSVISKLVYFFYNVIAQKLTEETESREWRNFASEVVMEFKKWFPVSAWGKRRFIIEFEAHDVKTTFTRTVS
jgi:predicted ATPase